MSLVLAFKRNSGESITIDSPEAPLVFKYYGILKDHIVKIKGKAKEPSMNPDSGTILYKNDF